MHTLLDPDKLLVVSVRDLKKHEYFSLFNSPSISLKVPRPPKIKPNINYRKPVIKD